MYQGFYNCRENPSGSFQIAATGISERHMLA